MALVNWRPVLGGAYEVSDTGLVRRARPGRGRTHVGRILKPHRLNGGYLCISVWDVERCRRRRVLVHVLVAEAFLGPRPDGTEVNHRDGDPSHNSASNLEYVSHAENIRHGYRAKRRGAHPLAKVSDKNAAEIRRRRSNGERGVDLAREFGVSPQLVSDIYHGRVRP